MIFAKVFNVDAKSIRPNPPRVTIAETKDATASSKIAAVKKVTPFTALPFIDFAPKINGCISIIKRDKLSAMEGRADAAPVAIPPTIPPTNFPIAVPIV